MNKKTQRCQKCGAVFPATDQICPSCLLSLPEAALHHARDIPPQATSGRSRSTGGDWSNVPLSGMIPGVIMAVTHARMAGAAWLLPTGLAYGICILNPNFRFSSVQKIIATAITLAIGSYGQQIMLLFFHGNTHP